MPEGLARELQRAGIADGDNPPKAWAAKGCTHCKMTGYKGRIGIYELLVFDDSIRSLVREGGANDRVRTVARRNGMRLMHEYALDHVLEGRTTLDEVQRVVPMEQLGAFSCAACQRELATSFAFCPFCGARTSLQTDSDELQHSFMPEKVASE